MTTLSKKEGTPKMGLKGNWGNEIVLALVGGLGFWMANFAISFTPTAAEYRAALSISYFPMLLEAMVGGLVIGLCVSYCLSHFYDKIPTKSATSKSIILSVIVLTLVTMLIEVPAKFFTPTQHAWRYFLMGFVINALRIPVLGLVIGHFYSKLDRKA
jgi:hypothetical protein